MSFIQKSDAVVINTKLTNIGRQLLASGNLTFKSIEFGDSEVDYDFLRGFDGILEGGDLSIMRPKDANPNIKTAIPISDSDSTITKTDIKKITPDIRLVVNTAKPRGLFTGSTSAGFTALTSTTYIKGVSTILINTITGGTVFSAVSTSNISAGTMLLFDWRNPKLSFNDLTGVIGEAYPRQFLWYKVQSVNGNYITVDRNLPNFNGAGVTDKCVFYVYPPNNAIDNYYSTGNTTSYWNYNTLAFDSTCNIGQNDDVVVWNLNIVYKDTPIGVLNNYTPQYYDGAIFSGFKEYIQGQTTNSQKSQFAIIHYTNKSISNYYGEGFYNDTFRLSLPTIMYHAKTDRTMGIVLSAKTKQVQPTNSTGFTTEYYDLIETTSQNVVGKVFNDLRIAVIEDEELVNVLALKSDRSHTLPLPVWGIKAEQTDINSLLIKASTNPSKYLALTYLFTNENVYDNGYDTNTSLGLNGGIHCSYIKYFPQSSINAQNFTFSFNSSDLKFMIPDVASSDGTGFNANKFYILAQIVDIGLTPNPASWQLIDYTTKLNGYGSWDTIPVDSLTNYINVLDYSDYTGGTQYNIESIIGDLPTNVEALTLTNKLGFGEESILLGNVDTSIKATVFKTKISHTLGFADCNTSNNPTWDEDDVYVTEAAIYDQNNNLVAIGKLNNPVKKNTNKLFTVELDMDF